MASPRGMAAALAGLLALAVCMLSTDAFVPGSVAPAGLSWAQTASRAVTSAGRPSAPLVVASRRPVPARLHQMVQMSVGLNFPKKIGTIIPGGFAEGVDYVRDGKGIQVGDLVLVSRSDGRCVCICQCVVCIMLAPHSCWCCDVLAPQFEIRRGHEVARPPVAEHLGGLRRRTGARCRFLSG